MAARGDNNFTRYVYMGEEGERIPDGATHIIVHEFANIVRVRAFDEHPNIVEVICHDKVEKIEKYAFWCCPSLRRVIMLGVKIVEECAFFRCDALTDVECGMLEIIGSGAFYFCKSLMSINLSSTRIVGSDAFSDCEALMDATFGTKLERLRWSPFRNCISLERITIPFRDGLIASDKIFTGCRNLKYADLVEGGLHETIAALHSEYWRNDMNEKIDEINQILSTAYAGYYKHYDGRYDGLFEGDFDDDDSDLYGGDEVVEGEKAIALRTWIESILDKIGHYKAEHRRLMEEDVAPTFQRFLPQDIVRNSVLPFLELPPHTFGVVDRA